MKPFIAYPTALNMQHKHLHTVTHSTSIGVFNTSLALTCYPIIKNKKKKVHIHRTLFFFPKIAQD